MIRHWHPTQAQRLILHAALDRGESAIAAWRTWEAGDHRPDDAIARLLPLVAHNLVANGFAEPATLRGVRRRAWIANTRQLSRLMPLAAALVDAGMPIVILKGVALAPLYYGDLGLRPLSDVDVLVRPADVPRAVKLLTALDIQPGSGYARALGPALAGDANLADAALQHGLAFATRDGRELDLHWAVMLSNVGPHSDARMWARAVPFEVAGTRASTLSPADHLLHAIVHGLWFNDVPNLRWIADAFAILRAGEIDWAVFLDEVAQRHLALPVREGVDFLVDELALEIPPWVRARLASVRSTVLARLRYADLLQDWSTIRPPWTLVAGLARFVEGRPPLDALRVAVRYFTSRIDPRGPRHAVRQVIGSLRQAIARSGTQLP